MRCIIIKINQKHNQSRFFKCKTLITHIEITLNSSFLSVYLLIFGVQWKPHFYHSRLHLQISTVSMNGASSNEAINLKWLMLKTWYSVYPESCKRCITGWNWYTDTMMALPGNMTTQCHLHKDLQHSHIVIHVTLTIYEIIYLTLASGSWNSILILYT